MSDTVLVAIIAAIPPTLMAIAILWQGRKVAAKTNEIHVLVNSNMATLKADLALAKETIVKLKELSLNKVNKES